MSYFLSVIIYVLPFKSLGSVKNIYSIQQVCIDQMELYIHQGSVKKMYHGFPQKY